MKKSSNARKDQQNPQNPIKTTFTSNKRQLQLDFTRSKMLKTSQDIPSPTNNTHSPISNFPSKLSSANSPFHTPQLPRKLIIKPLAIKPKISQDYIDISISKLCSAVDAIHSQTNIPESLEILYRLCENVCIHGHSLNLHSKLLQLSTAQVTNHKIKLQKHLDDPNILLRFNQLWENHANQTIMIRNIFLYLDRTYLTHNPNFKPLWETGLELFRENIVNDPNIQKSIITSLLDFIQKDRNLDQIPILLLRNTVKIFQDLAIYFSVLEGPILAATTDYYRDYSSKCVSQFRFTNDYSQVARYIDDAFNKLESESARCGSVTGYLDIASRKNIIAIVDKQMVDLHIHTLLNKGFNGLMDSDRLEDLSKMFKISSRVNKLHLMRKNLADYIKLVGETFVTDKSLDDQMISNLLKFKDRMDNIVASSFENSVSFMNCLKESFELFINVRENRPAELLAKHVDALLKSRKGITENEIESLLDKSLVLFRFIQGKDVFEAFYKKDLAKRLLLSKSSSFDAEKSMLAKLKSECGPGFTNKLEGMFKDIDLSKDIMSSFKEYAQYANELNGLDLNVNVLTDGYWPSQPMIKMNIPNNLAKGQEVFKNFYLSKHKGRKLTWQNSLAHCILKAEFKRVKKELIVSLLQCSILLLFNESDSLTFYNIKDSTGIEEKELIRALSSLVTQKIPILLKEPESKEVTISDIFKINMEFSNPHFRIKLNSIQIKETPEEQGKTTEKVFQDRIYVVDAAIVRIMKSRKTMTHQLLISELCEHLKFPTQTADLKKRIESLIDRDYLERDSENPKLYHYVA